MRGRFAVGRIVLLGVLALAPACSRAEAAEAMPSVRLGMSPRDVRDRFDEGAKGAWQTKVLTGPGDDTQLEWVAGDPGAARVTTAKFEFHLGMLVAVRAHLREPVAAARIDVTERTVTSRSPTGPTPTAGSDLVILARDCPTHRDEASALAGRASR